MMTLSENVKGRGLEYVECCPAHERHVSKINEHITENNSMISYGKMMKFLIQGAHPTMGKVIAGIALAIFLFFSLRWLHQSNANATFTRYKIEFPSLPQAFHNFKIAHISDFHNTKNERIKKAILRKLKHEQPDMIAITGDLIDSRRTDIGAALTFINKLADIAPCYYVTGNHESRLGKNELRRLMEGLEEAGVHVLSGREAFIARNDETISIIGIDDPCFSFKQTGVLENPTPESIDALSKGDAFSILLSHRPELYETYKKANVHLVLAGHAHGGQFRLPYIGGLFAPNQGFFPKYDGGKYEEDDFAMVVSRGVGNSLFPVRFNNPPEVVFIELKN